MLSVKKHEKKKAGEDEFAGFRESESERFCLISS